MAMKPVYYLINETVADEETVYKHHQILHEDKVTAGGSTLWTLTFKQVLQTFGAKNRNWNGRVYTANIVWGAIQNNPLIQYNLHHPSGRSQWIGEYGHPEIAAGSNNNLTRQMTISPPLAAWVLANPKLEGDMLVCEATTLAGGYGDMVRDRALTGTVPQASARAIGGVDAKGNVLPSYTLVTYDCVFNCSHKLAVAEPGTYTPNMFNVPVGNSMSESAVAYDFRNDQSFKDFLLSESTTKDQINCICDAFDIDAHSMVIDENSVRFTVINEDGLVTIVMPIRTLVGASMYELFK